MWCSRPKNEGITKRKTGVKPVKSRKIGTSQFFHKGISTHLLTVLIICVILHAEQRKREKIKGSQGVPKIGKSSEVLSDR